MNTRFFPPAVFFHRFFHGFPKTFGKRAQIPKDAQLDPVFLKLLPAGAREFFQRGEKEFQLAFRPVPILRGKGEHREIGKKFLLRDEAGDAFHRCCSLAVPFGAGEPAGLGPPTISIHDDGHMLRKGAAPHFLKKSGQ